MVEGGMYSHTKSTKTGYIKIELPSSNSHMMMQFYVDIYNYSTKTSHTFRISGYNYGNSTNKSWLNTSVINLADANGKDHTVRFCRDRSDNSSATKHFILIGDANQGWNYPQVNIRDFFGGFHTTEAEALKPWKISFTTSAPPKVDATHTNNFPKSTALGPKGNPGD